jgi:molecular chaperone DnaK
MKKSIGIDLGTTNSVISFKDVNIKIIQNKENEELTRSCVGIRNEEILVGRNAYQLLRAYPSNTILSIKRLMGGAINDDMVQQMINSNYYKFNITSLKGGTADAVAVILDGKQYTPEQISSKILLKLKEDAEYRMKDEVTHAVITVPAYFTEKQKNATKIAARLAGLKVQKLLAEPTAAAIAYGYDAMKAGGAKTVLIYDFGGGTFDLSILTIVDKQYLEVGTGGDRWMGGDDLDRTLQDYILNKIESQYNISDINKLISNLPDVKKFRFEATFRERVEDVKIQLSSSKSAPLTMDGFEDENGEWIDFDIEITRDEFEKLIKPFVKKSIDLIESLLKEVGYEYSLIDSILLVGGTSCIPLVKQMLSQKYGSDKIQVAEKPMLAIAEGAGILANRLEDIEEGIEGDIADSSVEDDDIVLVYNTKHNYYLELENGEMFQIIEKQTPLPANTLKVFKTTVNNQKIVEINLFAKVEDDKMERQTIGYYAIDEDLPIESELVFDISLDIDEVFEITVYPKNDKSKARKIVLGRGNKDSKAMEFLSKSLIKMIEGNYSEKQKEYFFKSIQKEIENINAIGLDKSDSEKWDEVGTNAFTAFEQAERIKDDIDEDKLTIVFAQILINEYPELIGSQNVSMLERLLQKAEQGDNVLGKIQAIQNLKEQTDKFPVLITLFTIKLASNAAAKKNPADANKLLQMHDQIVAYFKQANKDAAFSLLDDAIELRDKYEIGAISSDSIRVKK